MEHFRIAFWIVTLFGCYQTKNLPLSDWKIDSMRKSVECPSDSTFYAPTNVKKPCITTALDCIRREFDVTVKEECTDPEEYIDQTIDVLDHLINERLTKGHALTNSSECACESWSQTPFIEFLKQTKSLVQLQNTAS